MFCGRGTAITFVTKEWTSNVRDVRIDNRRPFTVFPECFSINFERHECDDGTRTVLSEIVARWSLMCPECITSNTALLQARSLLLSRYGLESHECVDSTGTVMSEIVASTRWQKQREETRGVGMQLRNTLIQRVAQLEAQVRCYVRHGHEPMWRHVCLRWLSHRGRR